MSNDRRPTRVYLSGERFFRYIGDHGLRFLERYEVVREYFAEIVTLVNKDYNQRGKLNPEEIALQCNKDMFRQKHHRHDSYQERPMALEEAMDRWITMVVVGYDAFRSELLEVIRQLYRDENIIRCPNLDVTVVDIDTTADEDLVLFITYDYLPF